MDIMQILLPELGDSLAVRNLAALERLDRCPPLGLRELSREDRPACPLAQELRQDGHAGVQR